MALCVVEVDHDVLDVFGYVNLRLEPHHISLGLGELDSLRIVKHICFLGALNAWSKDIILGLDQIVITTDVVIPIENLGNRIRPGLLIKLFAFLVIIQVDDMVWQFMLFEEFLRLLTEGTTIFRIHNDIIGGFHANIIGVNHSYLLLLLYR